MPLPKKKPTKKSKPKLRSGYEDRVVDCLKALKISYSYETKRVSYIKSHTYTLDFDVEKGKMYIESKGYFKGSDRTKHLEIKKQHPDIDIRFLFQRDNKLSKKSKTTYSEWCKKNGFKYCISPLGYLPDSWIKEIRGKRKTK